MWYVQVLCLLLFQLSVSVFLEDEKRTAPFRCTCLSHFRLVRCSLFRHFSIPISSRPVLDCWGCHNKVPQDGWLKQQKRIVLQFWRLEVSDQGVGRPMLLLEVLGKDLLQASLLVSCSSLASRHPNSNLHMAFSLRACMCPNLPFL